MQWMSGARASRCLLVTLAVGVAACGGGRATSVTDATEPATTVPGTTVTSSRPTTATTGGTSTSGTTAGGGPGASTPSSGSTVTTGSGTTGSGAGASVGRLNCNLDVRRAVLEVTGNPTAYPSPLPGLCVIRLAAESSSASYAVQFIPTADAGAWFELVAAAGTQGDPVAVAKVGDETLARLLPLSGEAKVDVFLRGRGILSLTYKSSGDEPVTRQNLDSLLAVAGQLSGPV